MVLRPFTEWCNHHHDLILKPLLPQPLANTQLFSVSLDLPILDVSYQWNPYGIWSRVSALTQHPVSEIHPCRSVYHAYFIPFHCCTVFHCMDTCLMVIFKTQDSRTFHPSKDPREQMSDGISCSPLLTGTTQAHTGLAPSSQRLREGIRHSRYRTNSKVRFHVN